MKIKAYNFEPIGERIRQARLNLRYTQSYVADQMGLASKHISQLERGASGISISTLMSICSVLEVDSDYILFGKITEGNNNPFNSLLKKLTPEQTMFAEELLKVYVRSCGHK